MTWRPRQLRLPIWVVLLQLEARWSPSTPKETVMEQRDNNFLLNMLRRCGEDPLLGSISPEALTRALTLSLFYPNWYHCMCVSVWKSEKAWNFSPCFSFCRGLWVPLPSQSHEHLPYLHIPARDAPGQMALAGGLQTSWLQVLQAVASNHTGMWIHAIKAHLVLTVQSKSACFLVIRTQFLISTFLLCYIQLTSFAVMCCSGPTKDPAGLHPSRISKDGVTV